MTDPLRKPFWLNPKDSRKTECGQVICKDAGRTARIKDVPEWVKVMAPDAKLSTRDIMKLFGYTNQSSISNAVKNGIFPKADYDVTGMTRFAMPKKYWRKSTVMAELKRRMAEK